MHGVRKAVSFFLLTAASAALLAGCKGGSTTTFSAEPPTGVSLSYAPATSGTAKNPLPIIFTATGKSADGNPATYSWSFGDQTVTGSTQATTGTPVTHQYAEPGVYDVTLTVTDDHGTTTSALTTITVAQPADMAGLGLGVENWTWIDGKKYADTSGIFETQFTPDTNNLPSSRQLSATWYSGGKLWMFGGAGYDSTGSIGALNDLWNCTPPTTAGALGTSANPFGKCTWTWVAGSNKANASGVYPSAAGVYSAISIPGARSAAASWTDLNGNMWLFGGAGYDGSGNSGVLNDMWSFSANGQSEWVAGSKAYNDQGNSTTPQARAYATYWTDKYGNFWLFGGQAVNSSGTAVYLNDLWCFTPAYPNSSAHPSCANEAAGGSTNVSTGTPITGGTWTQVISGTQNGSGVYGSVQQVAATNLPGARINAQTWMDSSGTIWMFGGSGYDANGSAGSLSDVWKFNPNASTSKQWWTYQFGSNTISATEVTGTQKVYAATNTPSARLGSVGWTGSDGTTLWMFGGSGSDSTATTTSNDGGGALNELWAYDTKTNQWAFMAATNVTIGPTGTTTPTSPGGGVAGSAGIYSAIGVTSPFNIPGARLWANLWVDSSSNIWIFGGTGEDVVGTSGYLNDMWLLQTNVTPTH